MSQSVLFKDESDESRNLLPFDGQVNDYGTLFSSSESEFYFRSLMEQVDWKNDEVEMYGKRILTRRKFAWYGDDEFLYTYSHITRKALVWNALLLDLKNQVEERCGEKFNSCLLNLYHNGSEGMSWHRDDEKDLQEDAAIASLSFGASRYFSFRHIATKSEIHLQLENGSLLLMRGTTQKNWLHRLPVDKKVAGARINLTFRTVRLL